MTVKLKQRKRLDWYIVLTTFVLLIPFSTSPRAMNFEAIAASSALPKTPVTKTFFSQATKWKTVRENVVASNIYKDWINIQKYARPHLRKDVEAGFVRNTLREYSGPMILRVIAMGKFVPELKSAAKLLEDNIMLCSDEKVLAIVALGKKIPWFQVAAGNLEKSILLESDEKVLGMIAAGKDVPELKATAENLESNLMVKWLFFGRDEEVFKYLEPGKHDSNLLMNPSWIAWDEGKIRTNEFVYDLVFETFTRHSTPERLSRLFHDAELVGVRKEIASKLRKAWWNYGYSGDVIFEAVGLKRAKAEAIKNRLWNPFVLYVTRMERRKDPAVQTDPETQVLLALQKTMMSDNEIRELIAKGKAFAETSQFANRLERKFEPWLKLGN